MLDKLFSITTGLISIIIAIALMLIVSSGGVSGTMLLIVDSVADKLLLVGILLFLIGLSLKSS